MMYRLLKKYSFYISIIIICILGFILRLKLLLDNPSFWFDESALGYNVLTLKYKDFFGILHLQQIAPPLFLISAKFIITFLGKCDLTLRLFPFITGNLSLVLFYFVLNKYLNNKIAVLFGFIAFCFNLQILNYTVEFKPYIFEVLSMCIILYSFHNFNWKCSYKNLLFKGTALSLLPWFSFISVILLFLAYLINFSKENFKKWLCFITPSIISFTVFTAYYLNVSQFYKKFMLNCWEKAFLTTDNFWLLIKELFLYTMNIKLFIISAIFFLAGYIICLKKFRKLAIFAISLLSTLIVLAFFKQYIFYERFILFLIPLMILISVIPLEFISFEKKFLSTIILFFSMFLFIIPSLRIAKISFTHKFSKSSCARELMQYMMSNKKDSDIIFVNNLSVNEFLYYSSYYKFTNKVILDTDYKNNRLLYKIERFSTFNNSPDTWIYSSHSKINKENLIYTHHKNCNCNVGEILYVTGTNDK